MNVKSRRWLYFIAFLALTLFLCWQNPSESSSMTGGVCELIRSVFAGIGINLEPTEVFYFIVRKTGHCLVFAVLTIYGYFAFSATTANRVKSVALAVMVCAVVAIFTEYAQQFFNGRVTKLFDAGINLAGVIIGAFAATTIQEIKSKIRHCRNLKAA